MRAKRLRQLVYVLGSLEGEGVRLCWYRADLFSQTPQPRHANTNRAAQEASMKRLLWRPLTDRRPSCGRAEPQNNILAPSAALLAPELNAIPSTWDDARRPAGV